MTPEKMQAIFDECQELSQSGEYEPAARKLTALLQEVSHPLVANLLGYCLHKMDMNAEAERVWHEALKDDPNCVPVLCNLGNILRERHRFRPARELLGRAVGFGPDNPVALHNRAILAIDEGDRETALHFAALAADYSDKPTIKHTYSLALLLNGDEEGFVRYEARKQVFNRDVPPIPPYTEGKAKVIVRHEQGFGDTLMVARWLPKLAESGADVYLSCPQPLRRIIEQSGLCKLHKEGVEDYTHYFWTMDLVPRYWGDFPQDYLGADLADIMKWQNRLPSGKKKVGFCFMGASRPTDIGMYQIDRRRSLSPSEAMQIVYAKPEYEWVNLTREWGLPECIDFGNGVDDFADMAGLILNLDLVITVDTALAHLAGGLGVDCIMLSRYDACWRWWPYAEETPLYRNMRCFYQPKPYDWQSVIQRVIEAI